MDNSFLNMEYQLSASGLQVQPSNQWLKPAVGGVQRTGVVRWSLRADSVGEFILVINARYFDQGRQTQK